MDFSFYNDTHFSLYDKYERNPARPCGISQTGAGYCHHPRPGNETHATGEVAEMNKKTVAWFGAYAWRHNNDGFV